jgi:ABC-2 type transport system permease protein
VYLPVGILASALVLAFRTTGPLPGLVLSVSGLLGGVYFPPDVVPSWLRWVSWFVPLTYGLRSIRRSLLGGAPLSASAFDLAVLAVAIVVLMTVSLAAFGWALRYAKRVGTLAQY